MEKLTQLLYSIDTAYRIAAKTDRDVAANVSQKIEAASRTAVRRRRKVARATPDDAWAFRGCVEITAPSDYSPIFKPDPQDVWFKV